MSENSGAAKQGQVWKEINLFGKSISGLCGVVDGLEKSLSNISRASIPSPATGSNESNKDPEQLVEVAQLIREKRLSVDDTISRISDIVSRLEN